MANGNTTPKVGGDLWEQLRTRRITSTSTAMSQQGSSKVWRTTYVWQTWWACASGMGSESL